jgi:hypothetical protein
MGSVLRADDLEGDAMGRGEGLEFGLALVRRGAITDGA